jgi:hypothetical protein
MTSYSVYLQLPSISGGCLLHLKSADTPYHGDKGLTLHGFLAIFRAKYKITLKGTHENNKTFSDRNIN